jgi:hypothetical protein
MSPVPEPGLKNKFIAKVKFIFMHVKAAEQLREPFDV